MSPPPLHSSTSRGPDGQRLSWTARGVGDPGRTMDCLFSSLPVLLAGVGAFALVTNVSGFVARPSTFCIHRVNLAIPIRLGTSHMRIPIIDVFAELCVGGIVRDRQKGGAKSAENHTHMAFWRHAHGQIEGCRRGDACEIPGIRILRPPRGLARTYANPD